MALLQFSNHFSIAIVFLFDEKRTTFFNIMYTTALETLFTSIQSLITSPQLRRPSFWNPSYPSHSGYFSGVRDLSCLPGDFLGVLVSKLLHYCWKLPWFFSRDPPFWWAVTVSSAVSFLFVSLSQPSADFTWRIPCKNQNLPKIIHWNKLGFLNRQTNELLFWKFSLLHKTDVDLKMLSFVKKLLCCFGVFLVK